MIKKYRKKPAEIEAVQWTGDNLTELRRMDGFNSVHVCFCGELNIKTLEGLMLASIGDYIIKGVQGEFYPCKPDIFEQTYEEVKDGMTEEQPHWIPCSERLPEEYGNYLISIKGEEPDIGTINPNDPRGWSLCDANGFYWANDKMLNIIAWMPLPKPARLEGE